MKRVLEKSILSVSILIFGVILLILACIGVEVVQKSKYVTVIPNMDNLEWEGEVENIEIQDESLENEEGLIISQEDEIAVAEEKIEDVGTDKYYIKVNYGANVVTIYEKDAAGNYTVPVKACICSTGKATPRSGVVKIKTKWRWKMLMGGVYGQYTTQITGNILFHSVPYLSKNNNALEYWAYDKLGTTASAGCVRLTTIDAKWIYENVPSGTSLEFYSSEDPGPLGKPVAQKISDNVENRGWDPTDPDFNNPWNKIPALDEYIKNQQSKV